jgi:probable F420-dependent oxidoreductase
VLGFLPAPEERAAVQELEQLGYGTIWFSEGGDSRESMAHAALLLAWTERVVVATSITSIWSRDAAAAATGARTLQEAYPGRFVLGLGVSHPRHVELRGHRYEQPLAAMRAYLDEMDAVVYAGPEPAEPAPRVLAALLPGMLRLAGERTAGAHPNLVPVAHTAWARGLLGPGPLLAPKQYVVCATEAAEARAHGRAHLDKYFRHVSYPAAWRRRGYGDDDFAGGGSDRMVDELVPWGDGDAIRAHVEAQLAAGADHVAINPAGPDLLGQFRRLAPALVD